MSKLEKIDSNKVQLEIEVPETEVEQALARVYRKVVKKINLPGFRKGKAPRQILEARFGTEIFYEDALEILIPPAYEKAIKEQGLEPIDEPEMELVQMEKGKPLLFKAKVEIKPEVQLGNYKGIEIEQQKEEVTPEKVE
ncbi:MAG: trigger factor family protein, partial [Firmicutes bacterium]|nr:trigger factor family protein [Bacillota bacterium]